MSLQSLSRSVPAPFLEIGLPQLLLSLASFVLALAYLCLPITDFLYGLGGMLVLILLLRWPSLGAYLIGLTVVVGTANFYKVVDNQYVRYLPSMAVALLALVCWLPHAVVAQKPLRSHSPFTWIIMAILAWEAAGLLWAPHFGFGVESLIVAASNTALFLVVVMAADTPKRLRWLAVFIIIGALHASGWLIASKLTEYTWKQVFSTQSGLSFSIYTIRPGGLEGSNQVAGFLMFASLCCAALYTECKNLLLRLLLALTGLYLLGISMITGSRGALAGLLASVVGFLFIHPQARKRFISRTAMLAMVVLIFILLLAPGFLDRILVGFGYSGELFFSTTSGKRASSAAANVTWDARLTWWKNGFLAMEKQPELFLTGLGPGGFLHHTKAPETHNFYLAFLFDLGAPGVFLLLCLLYVLFQEVRRIGTRGDPLPVKKLYYASLLGFTAEVLVHGVVSYDFTSSVSRFPYFYLGVLAACLRALERQPEFVQPPPAREPAGA